MRVTVCDHCDIRLDDNNSYNPCGIDFKKDLCACCFKRELLSLLPKIDKKQEKLDTDAAELLYRRIQKFLSHGREKDRHPIHIFNMISNFCFHTDYKIPEY